jgi:hypothetical protein
MIEERRRLRVELRREEGRDLLEAPEIPVGAVLGVGVDVDASTGGVETKESNGRVERWERAAEEWCRCRCWW